jgi:L,D-peptidoglycan transpeptidase YkuD (ErfK/YbiS/YcfS/YnhG family)
VPVVVGRNGVGKRHEGDGRAPSGIFELSEVFGYDTERPSGSRMAYRGLNDDTACVDDSASRYYDRIVEPASIDGGPDWTSAEAMRRDLHNGDDLYELGVVVDYNPERKSSAGSCIFLHVWRGPDQPTAGCTAMSRDSIYELARWLDPRAHPRLFQGSTYSLQTLREEGRLPVPVPSRQMAPARDAPAGLAARLAAALEDCDRLEGVFREFFDLDGMAERIARRGGLDRSREAIVARLPEALRAEIGVQCGELDWEGIADKADEPDHPWIGLQSSYAGKEAFQLRLDLARVAGELRVSNVGLPTQVDVITALHRELLAEGGER